ncbi:MAG: DUF262 domain-containing protein [Flavobacteriales bacterium]|jgi:hypothetical protein
MNNNPTSEKLTFRELINKHKVEIPIIQRDYAQGREGKAAIRTNFLNALLEVINDKKLELDFVYGSVKNSVLQPLDGQQRLTTLFLLHWFVALKENQLDNTLKELLTKFTYETRTSSREFCIDLINKGVVYNAEKNISEQIIDSSWFFLSWKRDPTIKSMLTMLDAIQQTFQNKTEVWDKLNNISFHYIELQNFGLSDDLYIKMNARGKPLTDFENFKAKFEQYVKQNNWENSENPTESFSHQIDTVWTDLFWYYRNEENVFDEQLLNFFRTLALINYTFKAKKDDKFRGIIDLLRSGQNLSFNQYLELGCFDEDYFKTFKIVLNKISDKNGLKTFLSNTTYADEKEIFNGAIKNNLGYAELLKLFALYQHFSNEKDIDEVNLQNWMRIVRNLVEAHRLYYDNANTFADSLVFFSKLIPYRNNIVEYFRDTVNPEDKGFPKFIIEEEKLKAELITQSDDWKEAIVEIENHPYFNGQIGFLLDWCKDEEGIHDINAFREYIEKAKAVFSVEGLKHFDNFLFERALLATGDYLLTKGKNYSFLINNERDISWKRLLRDDNQKRIVLKLLFDKIEPTTLTENLEQIVNAFSDVNDWRYYFIKYPEIISVCGSQKLARFDDNNEDDILLLGSTMTSGFHKEYFSYSLYIELKNKISLDENSYKPQKSIDYWKYFELNGRQIAFDCKAKKYVWTQNFEWENRIQFENREKAILELTGENL